MQLHDDVKSQLNARYLEGLASIEKRKIKNEASEWNFNKKIIINSYNFNKSMLNFVMC